MWSLKESIHAFDKNDSSSVSIDNTCTTLVMEHEGHSKQTKGW